MMIPRIEKKMRKLSFSYYILLVFFILISGIITGLTIHDYLNEKETLEKNSAILNNQTEANIIEALQLTDAGLKLFDNTLNHQMREGLATFTDDYNRSGRNPELMDLGSLKKELGGNIDLYIINESGIIEFSTFPPDLGLDFRATPYFYEYLTRIRNSEGFFPDRVVREFSTGKYRKFAYMPTPDHNYILELGLSGEAFEKERQSLRYQDIISRVASRNPNLDHVKIYNTNRKLLNSSAGTKDPWADDILKDVIASRSSMEVPNRTARTSVKYLFVDLKDPDYGSDTSLVVELTYNNHQTEEALAGLITTRLIIALLVLLACSFAAFLFSRYLTIPIGEIVEDVDKIAKGDLGHKIRSTRGREFAKLETSINVMVSTLKDMIRKEQEIEQELRESEERYRVLFQKGAEGILVADLSSRKFLYANTAISKMLGYSVEELTSLGVGDIHPPEYLAYVISEFDALVTGERLRVTGIPVLTKDRTVRFMDIGGSSMLIGGKMGFAGFFIDITERKKAEEDLQKLNEELEMRVTQRTVQLESINRELESFSYMVSHDLRAPLRGIEGLSRIVREDYSGQLPEEGKKYLKMVEENVNQMKQLIDDLINFSHMNRKRLHPVRMNISDLVRETISSIGNEVTTRRVEFQCGDLPPATGDPAMIRLVFQNLLSNALKFSRTSPVSLIEIGSFRKDGRTVYFVRDNGVGFDMRYRDKLFGVFQRLHTGNEYEGTGLGLAIVQRIIHRHEGSIWAESEAGKGATFFFTLGGGEGGQ
jgi:PAS domain S-box-containing protein